MIRFIGGTALSLGSLLIAYILEGGNPLALVMLSGFLICFFVPWFAVLAVWTWNQWLGAWSLAFRAGDPAQAKTGAEFWKFSEAACYLAGVLASLAGGILILGNLAGADVEHLGHALGALLVAPTYGAVFGLVCRILGARVRSLAGI